MKKIIAIAISLLISAVMPIHADDTHPRGITLDGTLGTAGKLVLPGPHVSEGRTISLIGGDIEIRKGAFSEVHRLVDPEGNFLPVHSDMSDGSVRMLCWAVLLHSPELSPLLVIDEPEAGLHPAWMGTLAEWISMASERTQVIIATHSPDLLDHFTGRYEDVIRFDYDRKAHFTPGKLPDTELRARLDEDWELGDIYRVGDHAVGGWPW